MILVVLGIFNVWDLIIMLCLRSYRGSFYGFNLWICPGFIF